MSYLASKQAAELAPMLPDQTVRGIRLRARVVVPAERGQSWLMLPRHRRGGTGPLSCRAGACTSGTRSTPRACASVHSSARRWPATLIWEECSGIYHEICVSAYSACGSQAAHQNRCARRI